MKILEIVIRTRTDKIYNQNTLSKASGYDIIVYEIAKRLSEIPQNDVDLLTLKQFHGSNKDGCLNILPIGLKDILKKLHFGAFILNLLKFLPYCRLNKAVLRDLVYFSLLYGYIDDIIKNKSYDVIHVHGCLYILEYLNIIARNNNVKLVTTLHGLNSFNQTTKADESFRKFEKHILKRAYKNNEIMTFVSSGCIHTVQKYLNVTSTPMFNTTLNGCNLTDKRNLNINIRTKLGLKDTDKVLLYVGNISKHKNQIAVLKAFEELDEIKDNLYILFLGNIDDSIKDEWNQFKNNSKYKEHFIECGFVGKDDLHSYYSQANGNILISLCEGFGLSIVEGMSYGLPSVIDNKMEILPDVYDEKCIVAVDNTDLKSIARGIEKALTHPWDSSYIIEQSKRFSMENMTNNYQRILSSIVDDTI